MTDTKEKYLKVMLTCLFWAAVWGILYYFLQTYYQYHFYYMEQGQLFRFDASYITVHLREVGGLAEIKAQFLIQFFAKPYAAAAIVASLLVMAGLQTMHILYMAAPRIRVIFLYLLPVVLMTFPLFNHNYYMTGTTAYIICLAMLQIALMIPNTRYRLVFALLIAPLLYWAAGSIAIVFGICLSLYQLLKDKKQGLPFLAVPLLGIAVAWASVIFGKVGGFNYAFSPDMYYQSPIRPSMIDYALWASLPVSIVICMLLDKIKLKKKVKKTYLGIAALLQVILVVMLWNSLLPIYGDMKSLHYKKLDYLARSEQWQDIIKESGGKLNNLLYSYYLNLALAHEGQLCNYLFAFDQPGPKGLIIELDRTLTSTLLISDIYFVTGNIAGAQHAAFEGYVISKNGSPRFMKRLVQTNLIFGYYPIAEKYIRLLEQTLYYKEWAQEHRRFLYNDEAVASDPVLGKARKSVLTKNYLYSITPLDVELTDLAEQNPDNRAPIEYLSSMYLLSKNIEGFTQLIDRYYGTPVLPHLPLSMQEGVVLAFEKDRDQWDKYGVSEQVRERYSDYKKLFLSNKGNPNIASVMFPAYGNTFWFYFMFK